MSRAILIIGIVLAGLGVVAGIVAGLTFVVELGVDALRPKAPDQPLVEGEPGSSVAVDPLECAGPCFDESSIPALTADAQMFARLGLGEETAPPGTYDPTTAGQLAREGNQYWESYGGEPDECFFAPTSAPILAADESAGIESADAVHFLGTYEDIVFVDMMEQSARVFPDSASASAYLAALATAIRSCDRVEIGPSDDRYSATITPTPALSLPNEVAAIGWVREGLPGARWRAYTIDLLRGNVVVRVRLLTDGAVTEQQYRNTVELYAKQLATVPVLAGTVSS